MRCSNAHTHRQPGMQSFPHDRRWHVPSNVPGSEKGPTKVSVKNGRQQLVPRKKGACRWSKITLIRPTPAPPRLPIGRPEGHRAGWHIDGHIGRYISRVHWAARVGRNLIRSLIREPQFQRPWDGSEESMASWGGVFG